MHETEVSPAYWRSHALGIEQAAEYFRGDPLAQFVLSREAAISEQKSQTAEQAAEVARVADEAMYDQLTGVYNRKILASTYAGLRNTQHHRTGEDDPLSRHSLIVIDGDRFKNINDTLGHPAGDRVLQAIAWVIKENVRQRDVVARIGGEEFVVILPRATAEDAVIVAERIRKAAETDTECLVTLSAGVAEINLDETFESNFTRADIAVYEAKKTRNAVVEFSQIPEPTD